jgi:hypothetical protein
VSDFVFLFHPALPADQTIRVDRRRMGPRLAAGWEEVKTVQPLAAEPPAEPESDEPTESAPKRRSRKNTEEQ